MPTNQELSNYLTDPVRDDRYGALIAEGNNGEIYRLLNEPGFGTVTKLTLTGSEIFEAIDLTEYESLSAAAKDRVKFLMQLSGNIKVDPDSKARAWLLDAFSSGTATRNALIAAVQRPGSEAEVQWGSGTVITIDQIREAL